MANQTKTDEKLNYGKTILAGFGFLATSIAWQIYDPYITKILNRFLLASPLVARWSEKLAGVGFLKDFMAAQGENTLTAAGRFTLVPLFIGVIMTFDNIFGVIFQPAFGKLSDRCHSRWGKRRPFILIGAPISALLFALIPWMGSLPAVMICIILFVFVMSLWRSPVVALMPDLTPPALRSEGNAVINLMGGVGGAIGMGAGTLVTILYVALTGIPKSSVDEFDTFPYVFLIGSVVMIVGMLVLMFFVKEKDSRLLSAGVLAEKDARARKQAEKAVRAEEKQAQKNLKLCKAERTSLIFMLAGLFFLFCGTNAVTTFFALFADEILHRNTAQATLLMLIFALCSMAAALPSGWIGKKFGRKKTVISGLVAFLLAFVVFFGVFLGLIGAKGLSIKEFTRLNQAYSALETRVTEWNKPIQTEIKAGTKTQADLIYTDDYILMLETEPALVRQNGGYADFHRSLLQENFDLAQYQTLANEILGQSTNNLGQALSKVADTVRGITKILGLLIYPVMVIAGLANMMITVNTLPLVLEIGGVQRVGTFTGYYYTATFSAQIASPIVYGILRMFSGSYISLFYYSPIAFALALLAISFVRHGEAVPEAAIKKIADNG
ncbi:MAG: MFS transporter [Oscillospiraceae bacterium]|jgi:MFS family permease|nr:MFS transporter [Oscillospiraceae bacterium]